MSLYIIYSVSRDMVISYKFFSIKSTTPGLHIYVNIDDKTIEAYPLNYSPNVHLHTSEEERSTLYLHFMCMI